MIATNVTRSGLPKSIDQIGRRVNVEVDIANGGPSAIGQGRLTIHLPFRTPCTRNSFLLYLHKVSVDVVATRHSAACYTRLCVHTYVRTYVPVSLFVLQIHQQNMQCTVSPPNALDTLRLAPSDASEQPSTQGSNRDTHLEDIPGNCSNADSTVHVVSFMTLHMHANSHRTLLVYCMCVEIYACVPVCEWVRVLPSPARLETILVSFSPCIRYVMQLCQDVQLWCVESVPIRRARSTLWLLQLTLMTSFTR